MTVSPVLSPFDRMTTAQTARFLKISRGRLAELTLDGSLERGPDGTYCFAQVEAFAHTMPTKVENRLPRMQDKLLRLLGEWGGEASVQELRAGAAIVISSALEHMDKLVEIGVVKCTTPERRSRIPVFYAMTDAGWKYVQEVPPPNI